MNARQASSQSVEDATNSIVELGFVFERAHGARLAQAEGLLRWFCQLHESSLTGFDAAYDGPRRTLYAFVRLGGRPFGAADQRRIRFWVARAGGRVTPVDEMPTCEWEELQRTLSRCDVRAIGVEPANAVGTVAAIATAAGLDPGRRCLADERPTLTLEIGGPGWEAVRWDDAQEALFVASPISPPLGDPIQVALRSRGVGRAFVEWARVVEVRDVADAGPGRPSGFALGLSASPAELRREIERSAPTVEYGSRAAPRFSFHRPLDAYFRRFEDAGDGAVPRPGATAGWIENLSLGGAFVRTPAPVPARSQVELSFVLPSGARLTTRATVAFVDVRGMGVRFSLERRAMARLHEALTRLSAHPRRALVIDDDGLTRQRVADALVERGFDVLTAGDAEEGLRVLAEELLSLDLLVTDNILPGTLGEELVATIRRIGGESELVIAVMTASPDGELAARLRVAGADLLLGKALGPEIIALKVDALLAERVMGRPGGKVGAALPRADPTELAEAQAIGAIP